MKIDQVYVLSLEAECESLRKRNGDLVVALSELDPDNQIISKPIGNTRAKRLVDLVEATLAHVYSSLPSSELRSYAEAYLGYWEEELERRALSSARGRVMAEKKRGNG